MRRYAGTILFHDGDALPILSTATARGTKSTLVSDECHHLVLGSHPGGAMDRTNQRYSRTNYLKTSKGLQINKMPCEAWWSKGEKHTRGVAFR